MNDRRTVLVCGATGKQGGAVARHLMTTDFNVLALTRNASQPAAERMRKTGIDVVEGDLDDAASLTAAIDGVYGVFSVQNFWETGYEREVAQGRRIADVAAEAGVAHFVYSSVGSADRDTGIPHFESKFEVENHLRSLDIPYTILRPVWFMNNWEADELKRAILDGTLALPLSGDTSLQQIDVDDVGAFAALAFKDRNAWNGRELDIAGDEHTMNELARTFSRVAGRDVEYRQVPWDDFRRQAGDEFTDMYRWFEDIGYDADIDRLRTEHPGLTRFEEYLAAHGWKDAGKKEAR